MTVVTDLPVPTPLTAGERRLAILTTILVGLTRIWARSKTLWDWIKQVRTTGVAAQKSVTVTLLDEARSPVQRFVFRGVIPMKYSGPTLAAKGGGDVAMEELVLSVQGLEVEAA